MDWQTLNCLCKTAGSMNLYLSSVKLNLGPMLGESYVIMNGLSEGEEIVTSGTFSVDAAAQLEGKAKHDESRGAKEYPRSPGWHCKVRPNQPPAYLLVSRVIAKCARNALKKQLCP